MMAIKTALLVFLLTAAAETSGGSPDGDDQMVAANLSDSSGWDRFSGTIKARTTEIGALLVEHIEGDGGSVGYNLVGKADDGSYVLHTVDRSHGFVALHELLLIRPVLEASALREDEHRAVTLLSGRYVIEKLETLRIDDPYDGSVEVEGNAIVVTIASP